MHICNEFWLTIPLSEMNNEYWELLCDRCGLCCLHKIEDIDTKKVFYTKVACKYLDISLCKCINYENRIKKIDGCIKLNFEKVQQLSWLPVSCAYRRIAEGKKLEWWHPLLSGSYDTVHKAGISVRGRCISERDIDMINLEKYIVDWHFK